MNKARSRLETVRRTAFQRAVLKTFANAAAFVFIAFILPLVLTGRFHVLGANSLSYKILNAKEAYRTSLVAPSESNRFRYSDGLRDLLIHEPDTFYSMVTDDVLLSFFEPELKREDGPVTVWQYRSASCVIDLYFSLSSESDQERLVHYDIHRRSVATMTQKHSDEDAALDSRRLAGCLQEVFARQDRKNGRETVQMAVVQ